MIHFWQYSLIMSNILWHDIKVDSLAQKGYIFRSIHTQIILHFLRQFFLYSFSKNQPCMNHWCLCNVASHLLIDQPPLVVHLYCLYVTKLIWWWYLKRAFRACCPARKDTAATHNVSALVHSALKDGKTCSITTVYRYVAMRLSNASFLPCFQ